MADLSDPRPVRAEDEFDVDAVAAWLRHERPTLTGVPEVRQFVGGASNLTYELVYPDTRLILRRPPTGTRAKSAHDMGREFAVQSKLVAAYAYVPRMVARCEDAEVIGTDFYVMERVDGLILRKNPPTGVPLDAATAERLCVTFVDTLVELHRVDVQAVGLGGLSRGDGYVARQVAGWSDRFRRARTSNVASFASTMAWLDDNQPPDSAQVLIHNDFRFDNLVLDRADPAKVVGVLDWEMATVGDPLLDLGGALAYWVQQDDDPIMRRLRRQPTHLPGMLTRHEVWERYADSTGADVGQARFYEVFGLFRLAVIAQQIYYRYHEGQTTNPAYRKFYWLVTYLSWRCRRVITGKVH